MVFNKIILFLVLLFCILNHQLLSHSININNETLVGMGIVLDTESWIGKSIHMCISMAISDFYALNHSYRTRIVLHTRDSKKDPLKALSAVDHLLRKVKVKAIIGPETHLQPKLLSLYADRAKVPIFSLAAPSSVEYPYLLHIKDDESTMAKCVAAVVESYKWRDVIFIYEDTDDGREILPYLIESLLDKSIKITHRSAISLLATCDEITEQLHKLMTFQTTIIIVHMSPSLANRVFLNAKRLGMMREEYAWILTEKTVDLLRSTDFEVIESIQGALGFRSYVPASRRLHNLTARWHNFFYRKYPTSVTKEIPVLALRAYDTIWALAESVEKVEENDPFLLNEVLKIRFKGISGEFQLSEGRVISNGYEIMNAIDYGEKRVGYWTSSEGIKKAYPLINSGHRHSSMHNEAVIWPGGSITVPKGRVLLQTVPGKKLKIGVLKIRNFKYFVDVEHDVEKNVTTATGFSIDVFNTCIGALPYIFIAFDNATYDDIVQKVNNMELDAVVGDSTILANRSELVDYTATYTDLGVGTLARIKKKDMWFFLKPLDMGLWLTFIASLVATGFVVWAIECMNQESECSQAQRIGTILWLILLSIFFAQKEKLSSNLSRFVMFVWLLVVLILITSYTATLSSLLTVEQFELASKGRIVGFHGGSFIRGVTISNLHFEDHNNRPYYSYEDYAHALSEDGEADAIVDEIPYIKMFLGKYSSGDYSLVSSQPITSGFGFIFQKGSPLVGEVSKEIARMRLDGSLAGLEKKWFENRLSIPPQNSTMTKALKLDRFGGIFIINGSSLALALMISVICRVCAKMEVQNIISLVLRRNLMDTIRYLLYKNVIRT
ncbi:glutamate receptor 1.2-like [Cynara cardunculus var. scolymus]|uniref:glutamate receptor 1.2-like n=1 Tax=Cynara cardunculus var. scolymus TaxID=59895 RepID=UPI000D628C4D|nr:glutamate receptor 1.2-like [Cynara cardunculus var. scolymus]